MPASNIIAGMARSYKLQLLIKSLLALCGADKCSPDVIRGFYFFHIYPDCIWATYLSEAEMARLRLAESVRRKFDITRDHPNSPLEQAVLLMVLPDFTGITPCASIVL